MPDTVRRVSYYYTTIPDKPGEGTRVLAVLRSAGVNLLALHAFPSARKAQVDFVPSDAAVFEAAAKGAKLKLSKPKTAFLVDGDDRVGALAGLLGRLAAAKINVTAVTGVCAGMGRYGAILWVKARDVNKAAAAVGPNFPRTSSITLEIVRSRSVSTPVDSRSSRESCPAAAAAPS
jgi:hypothetical protein